MTAEASGMTDWSGLIIDTSSTQLHFKVDNLFMKRHTWWQHPHVNTNVLSFMLFQTCSTTMWVCLLCLLLCNFLFQSPGFNKFSEHLQAHTSYWRAATLQIFWSMYLSDCSLCGIWFHSFIMGIIIGSFETNRYAFTSNYWAVHVKQISVAHAHHLWVNVRHLQIEGWELLLLYHQRR